jgi:hypothetical protein
MATDTVRNVVLVHGGFVDGSGWQGVYESLTRDGFRVSIVQNPTLRCGKGVLPRVRERAVTPGSAGRPAGALALPLLAEGGYLLVAARRAAPSSPAWSTPGGRYRSRPS